MKTWQLGAIGQLVLVICVSAAAAVDLAVFDFEAPANGTQVANLGAGPSGALLNGATVGGGVLNVDGLGQGLDIPLGILNPFGGANDWRVEFDFTSEDDGGGPLFSSDSSNCDVECNDAEQAGSINIFLNPEGEVIADAWFVGAIGSEPGLNDGESHHVALNYTAAESLWELFIDGEFTDEAVFEYSRDASEDRTRIADQTNPDFGFEDIDPGMDGLIATIDNVVIEAPAPPPVLVTIDRDTGAISMESILEEGLAFNSIRIESGAAALNPENWTSIAGNFDAAGDGSVDADDTWAIVSSTSELLLENQEGGDGGALVEGQTVSLGDGLWTRSPIQDIRVELFDTASEDSVPGAVVYTGTEVLFADLNLDGQVDILDWDAFVDGFGQDLTDLSGVEAYFLADLNGDSIHNSDDFIEFVEAFDAANGAGAFAAAVPEPGALGLLSLGGLALLGCRRRQRLNRPAPARDDRITSRISLLLALVTAASLVLTSSQCARAQLLAEYLFDDDTSDSSGNGRDGILDQGIFGDGDPSVFDGVLDLTGAPGESMIIPLGDSNPFDGSQDFTIAMDFVALENEDEAGYVLFSSADMDAPTEGANHSLALFLRDDGAVVYDNFFVGEVVAEGTDYRDEESHSLRVAYTAPADLGDPVDPNPGELFIEVDGDWLVSGEIAPNIPNIANHSVRVGSSLNEEFPFGDNVTDLLGTLDNVRVFSESQAPSLLRAEVDRESGDITFLGGEFVRDVQYYQISSDGGSLDADQWAAGNFDAQNLDPEGEASGETWDALAGDAGLLAEGFLLGSSLFDADRQVTLPGAFAGGAEDLEISVVTTEQATIGVAVTYVGEAPGFDCNGDGIVDISDTLCATVDTLLGTLDAANLIQGDIDGNGEVAFADFLVLSANFGNDGTYLDGNLDLIDDIAFADFLILSANFGQSAGEVAAAVPEPSSWALLAMSVAACGMCRGRRSR